MIAEDFTFDSHKLSEYNMKMYDPEDAQSFVSFNIEKSDITSQRPVPNHFGKSYSDSLTLSFFILKDEDICDTQNDFKLSHEELNNLRAWLESPNKPTELIVQTESDYYEYLKDNNGNFLIDNSGNLMLAKVSEQIAIRNASESFPANVHYHGLFTNVQPFIHLGDCYGLYLTFTCNAPYGFSDEQEYSFSLPSSGTVSGVVKNYSAEFYEYAKPTIIVTAFDKFVGGEALTIKNSSDKNRTMKIEMPKGKTKVVIDCERKVITDQNGNIVSMEDMGINTPVLNNYSFISNDIYMLYWLSLVAGANNLVFTGNSYGINKIIIKTKYIIKTGGF